LESRVGWFGCLGIRVVNPMKRWVVRRDVNQDRSDALLCADSQELFFDQSVETIDECISRLIRSDEICLSGSDRRPIMRGPKLVGFIEILATKPSGVGKT